MFKHSKVLVIFTVLSLILLNIGLAFSVGTGIKHLSQAEVRKQEIEAEIQIWTANQMKRDYIESLTPTP